MTDSLNLGLNLDFSTSASKAGLATDSKPQEAQKEINSLRENSKTAREELQTEKTGISHEESFSKKFEKLEAEAPEDNNDTELRTEDLYALYALSALTTVLEDKIEITIKEIASIKLGSENSISQILKLSEQLEKFSDLKLEAEQNLTDIKPGQIDLAEFDLAPDLKNAIETKVEQLIQKLTTSETPSKPETEATQTNIAPKENIALEENISLAKNPEPENLDKETLLEKNLESSNDFDIEIKELTNMDSSLDLEGSNSHQNPKQDFNEAQIFINLKDSLGLSPKEFINSAKISSEVININELHSFIETRSSTIPEGAKENLTIIFTPDDLGQIKLSIEREGSKLKIDLQLSNPNSLSKVEEKLNDLNISLKKQGYDSEIKVSVDSSASLNSNSNSNAQSFNEAKDEQKERILNTSPAWLKSGESSNKASFNSHLEGILE